MNEKGITPVVAIVLLLMMTVSSAAAAYYWMTTIQSDLQNKVAQNIQSTVGSSAALKIDAVECNSSSNTVRIYLRNPSDTQVTDLMLYVYDTNGALVSSGTLNPNYIDASSTSIAQNTTLSGLSNADYTVKVAGSPNVEATATTSCS